MVLRTEVKKHFAGGGAWHLVGKVKVFHKKEGLESVTL